MRKNKKNKRYSSINHSKYILTYHIIFTCKYRKKLLIKYGEDIKQIMFDISKKYDFVIKEMEVDKDHIHMMIESVPKVSPLQIVRVLKQQSTIQIWRKYSKCFLQALFGQSCKTFLDIVACPFLLCNFG